MIPGVGTQDFTLLTIKDIPARTYRLDLQRGIIGGMVDGLEAMKQAIYLILSTERFIWPIYSWNYGMEMAELIGKNRYYIEAELERRITDALMQDDRVISAGGFSFVVRQRTMTASFTVTTTAGTVEAIKEVSI